MGRGKSKAGKGGGGGSAKKIEPITGKVVDEDDAIQFFETQQWVDGLTPTEKSAVKWYTGNGFDSLNHDLRNGNTLGDSTAKKAKAIDAAIAKSELKEPIKVYRASSSDLIGGMSVDDINSKLVGSVITDKGYMSTSISKSGSFKSPPVLYNVTVPAGKGRGAYVKSISNVPHENEFLLKRGTNFAVMGAKKIKSGKTVVYLQVVD